MGELDRAREDLMTVGAPAVHRFVIDHRHYDRAGPEWSDLYARVRGAIPNGKIAIYLLRTQDPDEGVQPFIRDYFVETKVTGDGRSRNNDRLSATLYVGSSRKMAVRLREHLGFCSRKTYALKLSDWYPAEELPIELVCATYGDETSTVVASLEDALWEQLQPMFGRKGAR